MSRQILGHHAVEAALLSSSTFIGTLYYLSNSKAPKLLELVKLAKEKGVRVEGMDRKTMDKMAHGQNHQGLLGAEVTAKRLTEADLNRFLEGSQNQIVLVLDNITDPHNLGACLRSADAFGVKCVLAPKDKACGMTPVVAKVACGAAETVPFIQVTNLARAIEDLQKHDFWAIGLAGEADQTLGEMDFSGNVAIVMGSEGDGLRRLTKERCDFLAKIPMVGTVESLNVSVATGVSLFAARMAKNAKI